MKRFLNVYVCVYVCVDSLYAHVHVSHEYVSLQFYITRVLNSMYIILVDVISKIHIYGTPIEARIDKTQFHHDISRGDRL